MTASAPIAVIGSSGQVARALRRAAGKRGIELVTGGRPGVDLADARSLETFISRAAPALVVNAAAYTAVDRAESEPQVAFAINAEGPARLAQLCASANVPLVHLSTDYVFGGGGREAYGENEPIAPNGVYAASKAAGEAAIRHNLTRHVILRTAWVFDEAGQNFVRTMLRLSQSRDEISVVDDQRGTPTYAGDIADAILDIAVFPAAERERRWGTYHLTNAGETTWAGFARAIFDEAAALGLKTARVRPITTAQYPTPAKRPAYSVLGNDKIARAFGIALPPWQDALKRCMAGLAPLT